VSVLIRTSVSTREILRELKELTRRDIKDLLEEAVITYYRARLLSHLPSDSAPALVPRGLPTPPMLKPLNGERYQARPLRGKIWSLHPAPPGFPDNSALLVLSATHYNVQPHGTVIGALAAPDLPASPLNTTFTDPAAYTQGHCPDLRISVATLMSLPQHLLGEAQATLSTASLQRIDNLLAAVLDL